MKALAHVFAVVFILITTTCTTFNSSRQDTQPLPNWVVTQDAQEEYSKALKRWQSRNIANYQITVDVFSSILAPPCFMKSVLSVQENKLVVTSEITTPMPIQMPDESVMYNPECHDYENYLVEKQFEVVEQLLAGQQSYQWSVKFDEKYGYVTELTYTSGGESAKTVKYFDFEPK